MKIMIVIFPEVEELDFVGPYEVFSFLSKVGEDVSVYTVSQDGKAVRCANGLKVEPDYSFADAPQAHWLVIPGGQGRHREMHNPAMLDFVRQAANHAEIIASVCTGAFILANAGLLQKGRATTYHLALEELQKLKPELDVTGNRMERQGNVYMAAGVSAGIDLALQLCDKIKPGLGRQVAEKIEYAPVQVQSPAPQVSSVMGQMCLGLEHFLQQSPHKLGTMDSGELSKRLQAKEPPLVLDVREKEELPGGYIKGAMHIPLRSLPQEAKRLPGDREREIVTVCRSGARSAYAALYLRALGYRNIYNLEYGMLGWQQEGLPVERP
ncbi:DJ-1/PfpI family protein [Dethiobacter alkaliphilus]|uniref:DJ-1/PfpI family protein n=1 Tax=Dethiobacter alkaliphilus TaxID=427926 RepID=UPI002225BD89|nr:DJ-1/PfpI family protein [Dethiobacter alkaliphilus]MCW3490534.1 DJ-1/PfpI family protein [Dethiobacter alkaliphilus]